VARYGCGTPSGCRITDYISLGVITRRFLCPPSGGAFKHRQGQPSSARLPAQVVVYYVSHWLYMKSSIGRYCVVCWKQSVVRDPSAGMRVAGKSASQARTGGLGSRCGSCTMSWSASGCAQYARRVVSELALVSLDGSTFDVADEKATRRLFSSRSSRGERPIRKYVLVSLVETAPRAVWQPYGRLPERRNTLAKSVLPALCKGMLVWRTEFFASNCGFRPCHGRGLALADEEEHAHGLREAPADGSYLSHVYLRARLADKTNGQPLRIIDYQLEGIEGAEPIYRLATNPRSWQSPSDELAALYHEAGDRTAFDELKTICAAPGCAAHKPPIWCVRSSTDS